MRALIVDDSRAMRALLSRMVTGLGLTTSVAGNGREALQVLEEGGVPDVALVDWNMPEMNGLELVQAMRSDERYATVPVVMVTTETEMSQVMKALEAGANEYVMKPFTAEILHDKFSLLGILPDAA